MRPNPESLLLEIKRNHSSEIKKDRWGLEWQTAQVNVERERVSSTLCISDLSFMKKISQTTYIVLFSSSILYACVEC